MDNRRCTSEGCLIKANRKVSLDMPVATIMVDPKREWSALATGGNRVRVARKIDVNWDDFNNDNYLFSHCSIVSSVNIEEREGKPGVGYYIDPLCSGLINNNGNAWTTPVLLSTFKSFRGAENYLEHVQIPELSKGKILDAVARPVKYAADGGETDVYYIDILVATNRRHGSLVRDISGGKLTTMSMGCIANHVQCSKCGSIMGDNDPNCNHISNELLQPFQDENGVTRVVAELCGRHLKNPDGTFMRNANGSLVGDPDSVKFIEASWVDKPAFTGAVLNHYVCGDVGKEAARVLDFSTAALEHTVEDIFRMRVADRRGMMVLNIAKAELLRRNRESMINRVARSIWQ